MNPLRVSGSDVYISARMFATIPASSLSNPGAFESRIICSLNLSLDSSDGAVCFSAGDAAAPDDCAAAGFDAADGFGVVFVL